MIKVTRFSFSLTLLYQGDLLSSSASTSSSFASNSGLFSLLIIPRQAPKKNAVCYRDYDISKLNVTRLWCWPTTRYQCEWDLWPKVVAVEVLPATILRFRMVALQTQPGIPVILQNRWITFIGLKVSKGVYRTKSVPCEEE